MDSSGAEPSDVLRAENFRQVLFDGWNTTIRTSQSSIWYRDALIVGTGRSPLGFLGRHNARAGGARAGGKRGLSFGRRNELDGFGAEIWSFRPNDEAWTLLYESPQVAGVDGQLRARDRSIRASTICKLPGDREPVLYLGVGALEHEVVFLRSEDGQHFEESVQAGLGLGEGADTPSVRSLCEFDGRLYTSPTGKNYGRGILDDNHTDYPMVFETTDPIAGEWRTVSEPGFGDPNNLSVNELALFNGHLYAATINAVRGYQVWKTDTRGPAPYRWTKIIDDGAYRGAASSFPAAMTVFKDALYVTGTLPRQGRQGLAGAKLDSYGPYPAEMIRIFPDDSWELVTGSHRVTPQGLKRPITGMQAGFDHPYTHVFWRFAEYGGRLYLGTADWRWYPIYLNDHRDDLSDAQRQRLEAAVTAYDPPEFRLLSTADGQDWRPVTSSGFGDNPNNYGIRELISTPEGLFVIPTCKRVGAEGGGLEMWWGRP